MNEPLDIFGQNPRLNKLYTQLCFCFALEDAAVDRNPIVNLITNGLTRLTESVPWVSGQVSGSPFGEARITPLNDLPFLRQKDLTDDLPTFDEFRQASFPFTMLDEAVIASRTTLPSQTVSSAPVLSIQVNFVRGGIFLVVDGQHNAMDLRGQAQIICSLSKACRGEPFSIEEVAAANISRANVIPLLSSDEASKIQSTPKQPASNTLSESSGIWAYFSFSSTALRTLKTGSTEGMTTDFVSTDDVLSAFVWQCVTRCRMHRLPQAEAHSTFERQVDARRHLGISEAYTGNITCKVSVTLALKDLVQSPLGRIASKLREAISPQADIGLQTRLAATQLHQSLEAPTKTKSQSRPKVSSTDIKMSSWAKEDCYNFDFGGPLGKPEAVRRPRFEAWEGLAYMMPKRWDGEIAVALCLRMEDLQALKSDELFNKYSRYIG